MRRASLSATYFISINHISKPCAVAVLFPQQIACRLAQGYQVKDVARIYPGPKNPRLFDRAHCSGGLFRPRDCLNVHNRTPPLPVSARGLQRRLGRFVRRNAHRTARIFITVVTPGQQSRVIRPPSLRPARQRQSINPASWKHWRALTYDRRRSKDAWIVYSGRSPAGHFPFNLWVGGVGLRRGSCTRQGTLRPARKPAHSSRLRSVAN
jgi:hypothetical protein